MPSLEKLAKVAGVKQKSAVNSKKISKKAAPLVDTFKSAEFIEASDQEEESSDAEHEKAKDVTATVAALKGNGNGIVESASGESGSGSEEENGSEEEERSSSDDEMEIDPPAPPPASALKKTSTSDPSKSKTNPRPLHSTPLPPSFNPLSISSSDTTAAAKLFNKSNLSGKQIWYFTAPSSVPISSIQQISWREGDDNTVKLAGSEYGFVEGTIAEGTNLMVPSSSDGGRYKISSKPITKTLRLQLLSRLPGVTATGPSPHATVPVPKPVRPQPEGMRMRFRPIGVQPGVNVEQDEPAQFKTPAAIEDSDVERTTTTPHLSSIKQKQKSLEDGSRKKEKKKEKRLASQSQPSLEADAQRPAKKHKTAEETDKQSSEDVMELEKGTLNDMEVKRDPKKKDKAENSRRIVGNDETPTIVNNGESQERKKKKKDRERDPDQTATVIDSQETKEERRRRRKEKKEKEASTG